MEIQHENDDHGWVADLYSESRVNTTLRIINDSGIRIHLASETLNGCLSLGINLNAEEARRVSNYLAAQATLAQEDQ